MGFARAWEGGKMGGKENKISWCWLLLPTIVKSSERFSVTAWQAFPLLHGSQPR